MRDPATKEYNATRDLLVSYMEEHAFPSGLKRRVADYFDYTKSVFRERIYKVSINYSNLHPAVLS
jgi:hypothetical protein